MSAARRLIKTICRSKEAHARSEANEVRQPRGRVGGCVRGEVVAGATERHLKSRLEIDEDRAPPGKPSQAERRVDREPGLRLRLGIGGVRSGGYGPTPF